MVRLGALADLAGQHVGVDVECLPWPVGEPADEGGRLVAAEMPAARPAGCRGSPAGCGPSTPPRQAHTAGPLLPALGGRASRSE